MLIIIPARYASTRLPGKLLLDVAGKPLLQRVYDRAVQSGANRIIIATDDDRIAKTVSKFGAEVCLTSTKHRSGTDRIAEVIDTFAIGAEEIVVNLQGDEPLMPPNLIGEVAGKLLECSDAVVATACHPLHDHPSFVNPNVVKVVCDKNGYALYFSRAPIPWPRDSVKRKTDGPVEAYRHIGLYAYRAGFVKRYASWPPCPSEKTEQLEQLRVLWHGERVVVHVVSEMPEPGVDTQEDLERIRKFFYHK